MNADEHPLDAMHEELAQRLSILNRSPSDQIVFHLVSIYLIYSDYKKCKVESGVFENLVFTESEIQRMDNDIQVVFDFYERDFPPTTLQGLMDVATSSNEEFQKWHWDNRRNLKDESQDFSPWPKHVSLYCILFDAIRWDDYWLLDVPEFQTYQTGIAPYFTEYIYLIASEPNGFVLGVEGFYEKCRELGRFLEQLVVNRNFDLSLGLSRICEQCYQQWSDFQNEKLRQI